MLGIGKTGWIEKERPKCGPLDAIVKPLALSPCTSDIHTVWEGALGERHDMILGHEGGGVESFDAMIKALKPGGRLRLQKLASLVECGKLNVKHLITHRFEGFEKVEDALMLMKDKPADLIKPVVKISD